MREKERRRKMGDGVKSKQVKKFYLTEGGISKNINFGENKQIKNIRKQINIKIKRHHRIKQISYVIHFSENKHNLMNKKKLNSPRKC